MDGGGKAELRMLLIGMERLGSLSRVGVGTGREERSICGLVRALFLFLCIWWYLRVFAWTLVRGLIGHSPAPIIPRTGVQASARKCNEMH